MLSTGPKPLPRSPAGLLSTQLVDEPLSRSTSGLSTTSASPMAHPGILRRRSTDTSGGLDYYWSSLAGAGHNSSSSSLSLALSPSPSNFALAAVASSSSVNTTGLKSRSTTNLREAAKHMPGPVPLPKTAEPATGYFGLYGMNQGSGSSSQGLAINAAVPTSHIELESPGGWSGESDYSSEDQSTNNRNGARTVSESGSSFSSSPVDYRNFLSSHGEAPRGLLDPSTEGSQRGDRWVRESIASQTSQTSQMTQTTYRPGPRDKEDEEEEPREEKTPVPPAYIDRTNLDAPGALPLDRTPRQDYPSRLLSPTKQSTPTRPVASPSASGYTPNSGRIPFTSPDRQRTSPVYGVEVTTPSPQSAPAWKSEFGAIDLQEEEDPVTIKGRGKRTTLPATTSASSAALVDAIQSPERNMLSPQRARDVRESSPERRTREASPGRSPEPPPRSSLRAAYVSGNTSPLSYSPRILPNELSVPTIINTPNSPDGRARDDTGSGRLDNISSLTGSASSATINDLTEMLGGAIDAIGLVNSRDTPPPMITEPRKSKAGLNVSPSAPTAELSDNGSVTPPSLSSRGPSLNAPSTSTSMPPPPPPVEAIRKVPSGISLRRAHQASAPPVQSPITLAGISQRPWPASMLYGNIKGLKYTGDRAKAYARNINDLSCTETGLREWCAASQASSSRGPPTKSSALSSLGRGSRTSSYSTTSTLTVPGPSVHMRNVSSSSEFPMRADSYTAREISQRVVDPADAPSSLPPNLPYPQLQAQYANGGLGGMRSSPSMQSVSSHTSKRSFFSHIGKKSSKKDTSSLGPPSAGMSSKKDVRGLPISSPSYTSGPLPKSVSPHRPESRPIVSTPMGPRGPRIGSFTPPPPAGPERNSVDVPSRASLDTGLSRMSSIQGSRNSIDGIPRKGSLPPRKASAMGLMGAYGGAGEAGPPSIEDVNTMGNILPHVSKSIIRAYLAKYGDQMQAIGMYLEDEKRGTIMRA